jgi:hypothetical protein
MAFMNVSLEARARLTAKLEERVAEDGSADQLDAPPPRRAPPLVAARCRRPAHPPPQTLKPAPPNRSHAPAVLKEAHALSDAATAFFAAPGADPHGAAAGRNLRGVVLALSNIPPRRGCFCWACLAATAPFLECVSAALDAIEAVRTAWCPPWTPTSLPDFRGTPRPLSAPSSPCRAWR